MFIVVMVTKGNRFEPFYAVSFYTTLFIIERMLDMVVIDTYLLPLITYTRSKLHDKVERNIFQSSKYNKGAPFKRVGKNNFS